MCHVLRYIYVNATYILYMGCGVPGAADLSHSLKEYMYSRSKGSEKEKTEAACIVFSDVYVYTSNFAMLNNIRFQLLH